MQTAPPTLTAARSLPPGPKGLPVVGSFLAMRRDPIELFVRGREEHGDVVLYRFGPLKYVMLEDADAIHHVFMRNRLNYRKGRTYDGLRLAMRDGLVTSDGRLWARQRALLQPVIYGSDEKRFVDIVVRCANDMLTSWDEREEGEVDLHREMLRLSLRIAGFWLLDTDLRGRLDAVGAAVATGMEKSYSLAHSAVRLPLWVPTPLNLRFRRARRLFDHLVAESIVEHRARSGPPRDVLDAMIALRDENGKPALSEQQLHDETITMLLAAHETVASALSWTWMLLSREPACAERLHEEAGDRLSSDAPTPKHAEKLSYAARVLDESMRLYPPIWYLERAAVEDDVIAGFRIPAGTMVGVCTHSLHRNPRYWSAPERFDPDRFLPARKTNRPTCAYIPFSAGPRTCIGYRQALIQARLVLALVARRYRVRVRNPRDVGRDLAVTMRPAGGLPAALERLR